MNSHEVLDEVLNDVKIIISQSGKTTPVTFDLISQTLHNLINELNIVVSKKVLDVSSTAIYDFAETVVNSLPNTYDKISVDEVPVSAIFQRLQNSGWLIIPPNL